MTTESTAMVDLWQRWADERPDEPALTVSHETRTWGELAAHTNRLARAYAELGVREGDYVSVGFKTSIEFVESMLAALKLGAIPQPLSWRLPAAELSKLVELVRPRLVLGYPEGTHDGVQCLPVNPNIDSYSDAPLPRVVASAFKAAASGGSTGRPKIILSGSPAEIPTVDGKPVPQFTITTGSVCLFPGPLYHNTALSGTLLGLTIGAHVVLEEAFDPELTLALIEKHRVGMTLIVPTHMQRILRLEEKVREQYDLSSLQIVMHNAAACPPDLKRAWIDWLGPERIIENYTSTEQTAVASCNGVEWLAHPGTVGKVVQGEMAILDDDGKQLPPGEIGAIWMRRPAGAGPTYRYVGEVSNERDDGWDTVGDLGWMDEDGYLYLADRRTDMIISGGANIYPAEVEGELASHPDVLDCVVVGLPDEDLGKRVHAIVHTESATLDHQELATFLEARLVRYKTPRSYEFVSEPLRDDAGKVRRSALANERTGSAQ